MSTPLTWFRYSHGILSADSVRLDRVAARFGTPAYVYSERAFLEPFRELKRRLGPLDPLVCFAVKANSNLEILSRLAREGAGMDLVSGGELRRALEARVPASRIVFSGVGKTEEEITEALKRGIFSFHVESSPEMALIEQVASRFRTRAMVALRFNPDVDAKTHPYISTGLKRNKFGLNRREVVELCRRHQEFPHLRIHGISIHIGSQLLSLSPLRDSFSRVQELVPVLDRLLPEPLSFVDLGGGVGVRYKDERQPKIRDYCRLIVDHFGASSGLGRQIRVLIEPGRAIAGNAGVLLTRVLYRKRRARKDFLVLDAAMNDLMRPALYGSYHEIVPVVRGSRPGPSRSTDLVGPICESSDCFAYDRRLPAGLREGDLLAILSAGAYGFSMSSTYNSRPRPPEILIRSGRARLVRRRETYDDLVRAERL